MKFNVHITGLEVYHDGVEVFLDELSDDCNPGCKVIGERMLQSIAIDTFSAMLDEALREAGFKTREKQTEYYVRPIE